MVGFDKERFIKDFRKLRGELTQAEFAERLDIRKSYVDMIERGRQIPKVELLTRICNMAGTKASSYFIEVDDESEEYKLPYIVVDND